MIDPSAPEFWSQLIAVLIEGTWETIYMTTVAMSITFVVGLPLGLIGGRWAWIASARAIGVVTTPVVSVLLPVVVLAALGAAVLTSLGPARQARRLRTVDALRTE